MTLTHLINPLRELVQKAGKSILEIYESGSFDIDVKPDNSPLTRADHESNEIICRRLQQLESGIPIISEENKSIPYEVRRVYKGFWLVDPLDGTKEFIKRNGEFTINIALVIGAAPVLGVIYVPVTQEFYYATKGNGAFSENAQGRSRMQVASFSMKDQGLHVVSSRSHLNEETQQFINALDHPQTLSRGSALKFMLIAAGSAHLYPRIAPTMEWDTAAAQCIIEEAGGFVHEYKSRRPMHYNKESLVNPSFLAGGRVLE